MKYYLGYIYLSIPSAFLRPERLQLFMTILIEADSLVGANTKLVDYANTRIEGAREACKCKKATFECGITAPL